METQRVWLAWKPPRATTCGRRGQVRGRRRGQAPCKYEETPELTLKYFPRESPHSSFTDGEARGGLAGRAGISPAQVSTLSCGGRKGGLAGADKQPLHRFRSTSISNDLFHLGRSGHVQGFTATAPRCEKPKRQQTCPARTASAGRTRAWSGAGVSSTDATPQSVHSLSEPWRSLSLTGGHIQPACQLAASRFTARDSGAPCTGARGPGLPVQGTGGQKGGRNWPLRASPFPAPSSSHEYHRTGTGKGRTLHFFNAQTHFVS